jgi:lipopolysaccharide cholinephosphotransferase
METYNLEKIRDIQLQLYDVLCRFDDICKKYSITYYLTGGTAIGAVRHKGFIPWDDDIDVAIPRPDYERFSHYAQLELGEKYFWQTQFTDSEYHLPFGKIRKNNTSSIEAYQIPNLKRNGIFIDVFPLDGAPNYFFRIINLGIPKYINRIIIRKNVNRKFHKGYLEDLWMFTARMIPYSVLHWIQSMCIRLYPYAASKYFVNLGGAYSYEKETGPMKWLNPPKYLNFETRLFPVMNNYDSYLRHVYGDYLKLPPEDKRTSHYIEVNI